MVGDSTSTTPDGCTVPDHAEMGFERATLAVRATAQRLSIGVHDACLQMSSLTTGALTQISLNAESEN